MSARAIWPGARWAILAALLLLAARRIEWGEVAAAVSGSSLELILAAGANVASSVCKAMTWQGLVAGLPSAAGRSRRRDMFSPLLVGALVNSVGVARAGDVVKLALARRVLARRGADVPLADVAGAMMAEHVVAMIAWGALICAIAALAPVPPVVWAAVAMGLSCAAFLLATAVRAPAEAGCRVGCGPAAWRRGLRAVGRAWAAVHHSHRGLGRPRAATYIGLAALGQWAFARLAIAALLAAVGLGRVGLAGAGVILAGVTLAHALPITPGGIGVNQLGAMLPLTAPYGVAPEQALPSPSSSPSRRRSPASPWGRSAPPARRRRPIGTHARGQLAHRLLPAP